MTFRIWPATAGLVLVLTAGCSTAGEPTAAMSTPSRTPDVERIALEVQPLFDTDGPTVNVGPFSRALEDADAESIMGTVREMRRAEQTLTAAAMYVAAVRLYNLGFRDQAVEWFYAAQYRARLFQTLLDPRAVGSIGSPAFEARAAHDAFFQLVGPTINGYGGCSRDALLGAIRAVSARNASVADLEGVYPAVAFVPRADWDEANRQVRAGLDGLAVSFDEGWDQFQADREANGVNERFCADG